MYVGCSMRGIDLPCQLFHVSQYERKETGEVTVHEIYERTHRRMPVSSRKILILADLPTVEEYEGEFFYERKTAQLIRMLMNRYTDRMGTSYTQYLYTALCLIHQLDDVRATIHQYDLFITEKDSDGMPSVAMLFCIYKYLNKVGMLYLIEDGAVDENLRLVYQPEKCQQFINEFVKLNLA